MTELPTDTLLTFLMNSLPATVSSVRAAGTGPSGEHSYSLFVPKDIATCTGGSRDCHAGARGAALGRCHNSLLGNRSTVSPDVETKEEMTAQTGTHGTTCLHSLTCACLRTGKPEFHCHLTAQGGATFSHQGLVTAMTRRQNAHPTREYQRTTLPSTHRPAAPSAGRVDAEHLCEARGSRESWLPHLSCPFASGLSLRADLLFPKPPPALPKWPPSPSPSTPPVLQKSGGMRPPPCVTKAQHFSRDSAE